MQDISRWAAGGRAMIHMIGLLAYLPTVLVFISGVVLVFRGDRIKFLRSRCACGYDLRGLPRRVERCPECGALRETCRKGLWAKGDRVIMLGVLCIIASPLLVPLIGLLLVLFLGR
jgi:hypothetical protein